MSNSLDLSSSGLAISADAAGAERPSRSGTGRPILIALGLIGLLALAWTAIQVA
jgi:hypothetical protein